MSRFKDETGKDSLGRVLLVWDFVLTFALVGLDAAGVIELAAPAYALLATMFTFLAVWTAGPRMAQYLGPQISGAVRGVASAASNAKAKWPDQEK